MDAITILTWSICAVSIALNIYLRVLVYRQGKKIKKELMKYEKE